MCFENKLGQIVVEGVAGIMYTLNEKITKIYYFSSRSKSLT